jgi:hypothetical protein
VLREAGLADNDLIMKGSDLSGGPFPKLKWMREKNRRLVIFTQNAPTTDVTWTRLIIILCVAAILFAALAPASSALLLGELAPLWFFFLSIVIVWVCWASRNVPGKVQHRVMGCHRARRHPSGRCEYRLLDEVAAVRRTAPWSCSS